MRRICLLLTILCFFTGDAFAQQGSYGAMSGTITDATGASLPNAEVTVTDTGTGIIHPTKANGDGIYRLPTLAPGTYNVSASAPGFTSGSQNGVEIHTAQVITVNLALPVKGSTQTVTVSSDVLLDDASSQLTHIVTTKEIESFPLPVVNDGEREIQDFAFKMLPGASGESYVGTVNGGQPMSQEIYLDGISMGTFDTAELPPSVDAIGDANLQTGSMSAEYNGGGTSVENFSIRSGSNQFHGTLFEYFQNEDLNSNTSDARTAGQPRGPHRLNNFGGNISGPIWIPKIYDGRNKTFFFFNYEGNRKTNYQTEGTTSMPTQAMMSGDFSGFYDPSATLADGQNGSSFVSGQQQIVDAIGRPVTTGQIYDPATTRIVLAGQADPVTGKVATVSGVLRDPFPNNQIPLSRLDPVAANILKLKFPTKYLNSQVVNNIPTYAANQPWFDQNIYEFKIDNNINDANRISFFYQWDDRDRANQNDATYEKLGTSPIDTFDLQHNPGKIVRASYYLTVSPRIVNHFAAGYNSFTNSYITPFSSTNWSKQLGIGNQPVDGFPVISFGGPSYLGGTVNEFGNNSNGSGHTSESRIFIDTVSLSLGRHQIQAGTEFRFYSENDNNVNSLPTYPFSNNLTDDGAALTGQYTGNAFASFLLGTTTGYSETVYDGTFNFRRRQVGTFVQDNWKVNQRLSLNFGLRWEIMGGLYEAHGRMAATDLTLPNAGAGNLPGAMVFANQLGKNGFEHTNWGLVLPRVGFAYDVTPRLVWRGGFGINTMSPSGGPQLQQQGDPSTQGYSGQILNNASSNPQAYSDLPVTTLSSSVLSFAGTLPDTDPTQLNNQSAAPYFPANATNIAYTANYNLGFQLDLTHSTVAELNYVGNTSKRLYAAGNSQLNQLPVSYEQQYGDALIQPTTYFPYPSFPSGYDLNQALAPFPQYSGGGVSGYDTHNGWSRYDSMQATITRHVSNGLSVITAFTWSKVLTNANSENYNVTGNYGFTAGVQDVHNLRAEKAVALFNVPLQGKITAIYDLPWGRGRAFKLPAYLDPVAGGWTLSANLIYQSGDVLTTSDSFVINPIFSTTRPNYTGLPVKMDLHNGPIINGTSGPTYVNSGAFAHVPNTPDFHVALTTGNVPSALGNVYGPGLADENFSLLKNFNFGAKRYIQFRVDAINAFNRIGRGDPNLSYGGDTFGEILENGQDQQGYDGSSYFYQPRVIQLALRLKF